MVHSHLKKHAVISTSLRGDGNIAEIVSHPRRLCGLIAKKQAAEQLLSQQKLAAVIKIEQAISSVEAMRTENNASRVDWMLETLQLALEEIQTLNPLHPPVPANFVRLANQLQEVSVKFTSTISAA